jgi:oxygen-independent coproporphyrinogen-3 oxidase
MAGLYFHIPFCRRKCPYCDFYSLEEGAGGLEAYPDLLATHLAFERRKELWQGPFETVFFGGGTPSLLEPAAIGRVLEAADRLFGLAEGAEISLEANPGTVSPESLAGYRAAGVNRLSLGIQSLDPQSLKLLGRIHSPEEAKTAVAWARRAGFDNLSCDLMFALPGQTTEKLEAELDRFLDLSPDHLSAYGLTVEEETPFYHLHRAGGLDLPDEDRCAELFRAVDERLGGEGFGHYEISNHARSGRECRHNLLYWRRRPYLGIGVGAHSFRGRGWGERRAVPADLARYAHALSRGADPAETLETFERRGAMAETLYLGLRTADGVAEEAFRARFGAGVAEAFPEAVRGAGERLALRDGRWRLDLDGWLLFNHFIAPFL